ncbi:MAG: thioredoxin family protein [Thermoguttaceae bacterium]
MKHVQVLGTGCAKCNKLATLAAEVAAQEKIEINLEKVTDIGKIMSFGVMVTPALVVDGKVTCSGNLPSTTQLAEMLR